MFHNPEDVRWFKASISVLYPYIIIIYQFVSSDMTLLLFLQPVELWSKHGRRGRIKETVGTHGMFSDPAGLLDPVVFCAFTHFIVLAVRQVQ